MKFIKSAVWCFCLCFFLSSSIPTLAQADDVEWIHLSTLWDAPGTIIEISPTSDYAIISDDSIDRLVQLSSGEIILEIENGNILFSQDGDFVVYYPLYYEQPYHPYIRQFSGLNLRTGHTYEIEGNFTNLTTYEHFIISEKESGVPLVSISQIREIETGDIVAQYHGLIDRFSHDMALLTLYEIDTEDQIIDAGIINFETDEKVAEFSYPIPDTIYSVSAAFNADDSLLSLYFFPEEMQIISTSTWEVLYTLSGGITFSPDGRYIAHNNHAGYSDVQLIEAHTGRVLDEFLGSLSFSRDGQYWIRGEALDYDLRDWQIIDLTTNEVIFQHNNYRGAPQLHEDDIVSMWNFGTQSTQFFDLTSGELIREIEGGIEKFGNYMIVDKTYTPFSYLQNWDTTETYAIGRRIKMTPDENLALVSNGLFVDVYGRVEVESVTMPPPRSAEGIARTEPGEIVVYSAPNSDNSRIFAESNMLNPTYFDVLGKAETPDWLFVFFLSGGVNPEWIKGWIQSDDLEEIVSWDTVPVLNPDDPIASLRAIALKEQE